VGARHLSGGRCPLCPLSVSDLHGSVKERHVVEQRLPLRHVDDVQLILCYDAVRAPQAGFDAMRRLRCKFD